MHPAGGVKATDVLMRSVSLNTPGQQVQIQCDGNHAADRDDLLVGLSWDFYPGTTPVDLDASAVCFDNLGVVQDAAYFNKLSIFDGALTHSGDSLDGAGSGFDETIAFDVDKLPLNVHMVAIVVNAHDEGSNFTHVESANCVLQDFPLAMGGRPNVLADISIGCKGSNQGVVLCLLIRGSDRRSWTVKACGDLCATGRNFNECMPVIRQCVDRELEDWVKEERTLSLEKPFDMKKGENACLPNSLSKICVGLGWDCASSVDLDASVLVVGGGNVIKTCYYGNQTVHEFGLHHTGDNQTGAGSGDDETIKIDLDQAAKRGGIGTSVVVTVNIYSEGRSFSRDVKNAYIRIYAPEQQNKTLAIYWLDNGAVSTRGLIFAELERKNVNGWNLIAHGKECNGKSATAIATTTAVTSLPTVKKGGQQRWVEKRGQNPSPQSKSFLIRNMRTPPAPKKRGGSAPGARVSGGGGGGGGGGGSGGCCVLQ